jgi:hypothetical protein
MVVIKYGVPFLAMGALVFSGVIYLSDPLSARIVNSVGRTLPEDAAPLAQQIFRSMSPEPRSLDIQVNLYDGESTLQPFEPLLTRDEL